MKKYFSFFIAIIFTLFPDVVEAKKDSESVNAVLTSIPFSKVNTIFVNGLETIIPTTTKCQSNAIIIPAVDAIPFPPLKFI